MTTQMILALVVGAVMGFVGSMPIAGPVAVIVLERGMVRRSRAGLAIAVGAAAGESVYAFLASWGVGAILSAHPHILPFSRLLGAAVLVALGIYLAARRTRPRDEPHGSAEVTGQRRRGVLLGASLTLLNPTIIASWTVAVAAVHSTGLLAFGVLAAVGFAIGVGLGIVGWFALMLQVICRFQRRLQPETVDRVLHVTGWLVAALGVALAVKPIAQAFG
jgi:threonine/homoserine/homoserine lactone efflux protein